MNEELALALAAAQNALAARTQNLSMPMAAADSDYQPIDIVPPCEEVSVETALKVVAKKVLQNSTDPRVKGAAENPLCIEGMARTLAAKLSTIRTAAICDGYGNVIGVVGE